MPIIQDADRTYFPAYPPPGNTAIAKYVDLTKLLSMMVNGSLFFSRLDMLEDVFEGTTPKLNERERVKRLQALGQIISPPLTEDQIVENVRAQYELEGKVRCVTCVNCWNKYEGESAALWKIYSDFGKGIMIKSSVERLTRALEKEELPIHLSEIKYIDYASEIMPDGNVVYPIIHKQKAYNFENEIRAFCILDTDENWEYPWDQEKMKSGKYLKVNVSKLIEYIVIGPFAPIWFADLISDLLQKLDFKFPVMRSKLGNRE